MSTPLRYNWKVVGNETALHQLELDISSQNLAHAYIFSGPPAIGKRTIAVTLAHILQCEQDFCHECKTCMQISKGIHSETIEFRDDGEQLGIDPIRDLIVRMNLTPASKYKIVIIERAERMTPEAANCLLKMLEEPPPQTLFLLTTDTIRTILPTVISRCRMLGLSLCEESELMAFLQEKYTDVDAETLRLVTELSLGRPGVAFKILEDPDVMSFYTSLYRDLLRFFEFHNLFERLAYLQNFIEDKQRITIFLDMFTHLTRKKLLAQEGDSARYIALLDALTATQFSLRHNVNPRLALENLMISF